MFIKSGVERAIISLILSDKKTFYDVVSDQSNRSQLGNTSPDAGSIKCS